MGIDFLDLLFRLENEFGTKLNPDDFLDLTRSRTPPDVASGELLTMILAAGPGCFKCRYDLRGHGPAGLCPECATPFDEQVRWERLRAVLADVSGIEKDEIRRDSLLIGDLKMT